MAPKERSGALIRGLLHDGSIRLLAVVAGTQAERVRKQHDLNSTAATLASEGLVATLLLSAATSGEEKLLMEVAGFEPKFTFSGEATAKGRVRARCHPASMDPYSSIVGRMVTIKWGEREELHRGVAEVAHDSIERALHQYFVQSDETRGLVRIGSRLGSEGSVEFAGGFVVEWAGSGISSDEFDAMIEPLGKADVSDVISGIAFGSLLDSPVELLERRSVLTGCSCSLGKVEGTLRSLGAEEIHSMIEELGKAEVTCHFCGTTYDISGARLAELAASLN